MSQTAVLSDREVAKSKRGRRVTAPARFSHSGQSLAIPSLGNIKTEIKLVDDRQEWAKLALQFVRHGYGRKSSAIQAHEVAADCLKDWYERHAGPLNNLGLSMTVAASLRGIFPYDRLGDSDESEDMAYLVTAPTGFDEHRSVERKVSALEQVHKGLGATAIWWLDLAAWRLGCPIITPETARQLVSRWCWYGCETQEDWKEGMEAFGDGDPDMDYSPAAFDASIPPWITRPERIGANAIRALAKLPGDAGRVATLVLKLQGLVRKTPFGQPLEWDHEAAVFSALLRWNADDVFPRYMDDLDNQFNQSENTTDISDIWMIPTDQQSFDKWLREATKGLQYLRVLDELISLLSDKEES